MGVSIDAAVSPFTPSRMNLLEAELHYPFADTLPAPGELMTVAPGVQWLRMPLPFALDHINLWLLDDTGSEGPGHAIVDCGIADATTRGYWEAIFASLQAPVRRVIATHMHPDHIGNAAWLVERWGCPFHCSMTDYAMARGLIAAPSGSGGDAAARHFRLHGLMDAADIERIRHRGDHFANMVPAVPPSFKRLMDDQPITIGHRTWRTIAGWGHAPEHMALWCEALGVLISGDMVLPRISTNVSVWDMEPEADPLGLFLKSLARYEALPADTLVLPSHGKPFTGLHTRIRQLREHHDARLAEVREACAAAPQSAADLLGLLFRRKLDLHQTTFAMGEALAHLHWLWHRGELQRSKDTDGVLRFSAR